MKKTLLLLMLAFALAFPAFAEEKAKAEIISHVDLVDWSRSNNGFYVGYIAKDGHLYRTGDRLTFGPVQEGKTYNYLWERENIAHILADAPTRPISGKWIGSTGVIKDIEVRGNKKTGHDVIIVLAVGKLSRIEVRPFEAALASGEIVSEGMTREKAIEELKQAKLLLDLQVITAEEYDEIKNKMSVYIK